MNDEWNCGCSLIGGHICGKQKPHEDEPWASPVKKYTDRTDNALVKGTAVKCHRERFDKKSYYDGKLGTLLMFDPSRSEHTGRFLVRFAIDDKHSREVWCYEISKMET